MLLIHQARNCSRNILIQPGMGVIIRTKPATSEFQLYQMCCKLPAVRISTAQLPSLTSHPAKQMMPTVIKQNHWLLDWVPSNCTAMMPSLFEGQKSTMFFQESFLSPFVPRLFISPLSILVCHGRERRFYDKLRKVFNWLHMGIDSN